MTLKLESTTTKLRKGWNLAWYHHLSHITCVEKLRGLWQKLDALRVEIGPSLSKYEGLRRKLICFKGISFFKTYLNSRLFLHSICTIQSHILKFQPFLTSFTIFHAFNDLFWAKWPWNWKALQPGLGKGLYVAWYHHLTHITCVQKLRGLRQKLDVLRVQTGPSLSNYKGFRRKLIYYKDISFF